MDSPVGTVTAVHLTAGVSPPSPFPLPQGEGTVGEQSQMRERSLQIRRKGRAEGHRLAGSRVAEGDLPCVQEHARQTQSLFLRTVYAVARDRVPDGSKMHADLVCAPRLGPSFQQGVAAEVLQDTVLRGCRPAAGW